MQPSEALHFVKAERSTTNLISRRTINLHFALAKPTRLSATEETGTRLRQFSLEDAAVQVMLLAGLVASLYYGAMRHP